MNQIAGYGLIILCTGLCIISVMLHQILLRLEDISKQLEKGIPLDTSAPVNAYGESFTDALQNSLVRGQRGINTYNE